MGICCAKLAKQEARRKAYCSFDIMLLMCSSPRMWSPYQQNVVQPCMSCPRQPSVVECRGIHKGLMLPKHLAWSVGSMVLQAGSLGQVLFLMEKQKKLLTALCSTMDALHLQLVWWGTWQLHFTHLLPLSWIQIRLAPASCPAPQSMEKNWVPALPSIRDNPIYLADVLKLLPDPFSYIAGELEVVTENLFLQTWVWPCWFLILSPVLLLSYAISVSLRMSRLQSTTVTAWSSCGSFTHITTGAPNHKMLAGMQSSSQMLAAM